ncbi:MAG: HAMP domain-containing sensor histidine kinase [Marinirhabdus sp.]|nr:HAMP domain-containing sensor histidine kinase [Marinirhabdus sp.]
MKFKLLIVLSIATLISLIGIQGYLIYNSYELKQKTITIDARNAIARIYNSPQIDSISWLYRNNFLNNLELYRNNKITRKALLDSLEATSQEINPGFLEIYNAGLKTQDADFDIQFKKIVTSITISDSIGQTDLIYPDTASDTIILLGSPIEQEEAMLINNSTWQKDHDIVTDRGVETVDLEFKSSVFMNVTNWNNLIIRELSTLLLLSVLLFLFVVGLLHYSIQNLLKQKRVAEIKTDFINNITHELKTPLSTLSLATKTLSSEYAKENKEVTEDAIQVIERQNTRLQKLIDQVLKSSLGYQQIQLNEELFNVTIFLEELLNDYELTLADSIEIKRSLERTGLLLNGDPFFISTAIINLLNNAIKYGGNKLEVVYEVDTKSNAHIIKVKDNGIGISQKYHKYIFDKFYRVGEKDKHNYKGLGLGLYYTSQIIKAHGGTILVDSTPKQGTTFSIKIPVNS